MVTLEKRAKICQCLDSFDIAFRGRDDVLEEVLLEVDVLVVVN